MKTKFIILLGCLLLITVYVSGQNWNKIFKDIYKNHFLVKDNECAIYGFYNLWKNSEFLKRMKTISMIDTVFILQRNSIESYALSSTIWNRQDSLIVSSEDQGKTFNVENESSFTNYMTKLVSEWNTVEIKKEEIENAVLSSEIIVAIRIIFNKNKYRIDYLFFNDFFNIERDRWK
ncbi:hypothetical protein [Culturomica massiliensis]|uniref:hypothetical protein n=2 Tax=Culturomica TaxID=1926651 RepID=UPI00033B6B30|nr:hypothetical protein [Culturomica massiliensis]CCZ10959.1 uncharacterized protein BN783_02054 [Odoribacter sp. CAG:788]